MEQSIFTYCYKRYDETGGGWGFYSYSDGMKEYFKQEKSLENMAGGNGYEIAQNRDVWLVRQVTDYDADIERERLAIEKYHPEKFAYRSFGINNEDIAVFIYGRNLGREIVNEIRPANKLIYTLAGSMSEINSYPCFYYGDKNFSKMTRNFFKNTSKDVPAPALPAVRAEAGNIVTRQKVHEFFLEQPERESLLVNLFYSLLEERSGKKRPILICDRKENIIYWISAVTLLFPLEIALKIFFTTYDFLGTSIDTVEIPSDVQLCGVYSPTINDAVEEKATNYDIENLKDNQDIVLFDVECGIFPEVQVDCFESVIRAFCRGDEKPLLEFHRYLDESISYCNFDRTYTAFYPVNNEKYELFQYYNEEIKERMFKDVYPFLFDISATSAEIENALQLTRLAFDAGIVTKKHLSSDIYRFTAELLKNPEEDFTRLEKLDSIKELTGYTASSLVKTIINQNLDKWVEYFVLQNNTSVDKIIYIMRLLCPYELSEFSAVQKLCEKLQGNNDGIKAVSDFIDWWITYGFSDDSPKVSPSVLPTLFELESDPSEHIHKVTTLYMNWGSEYRRSALSCMEESYFANAFFNALENTLWNCKEPFLEVYATMSMLAKMKSFYAGSWHEKFFYELCNAPKRTQKTTMENLLKNSSYKYTPEARRVVRSIFGGYDFSTVEELADFSYLLCCKISFAGISDYPVSLINDALKRLDYSKKNWKKAVHSIPDFDFPESIDEKVRHILISEINEIMETEKYIEKEEKNSFIKKLFGKSKK